MLLFLDTETTGIPEWKTPSDDPCQPHIVQLAAALVDHKTLEIAQAINFIVRPDGWDIPPEVVELHGITVEWAKENGAPENFVVSLLMRLADRAEKVVGHNVNFDKRMVRIATKRYLSEDEQQKWKDLNKFCTMYESRGIIKIQLNGKKNKLPRLEEAYNFFTGEVLDNAHDAYADMLAAMVVYREIQKYKK